MKITTYLVIFATIVAQVIGQYSKCCEEYCYSSDRDKSQVTKFSTKTAYQVAKGATTNNDYYVPNCEPRKIWILARHGTRLPKAEEMRGMAELADLRNEIIDNYDTRRTKPDRGALCEGDLAGFRNWQWDRNITENHDQYLTPQGWQDMKFVAAHFVRIFPKIFTENYNRQKYMFKHTNLERTESSYKAFAEGIFGDNAYRNIILPPATDNDTLLKPEEQCSLWKEQDIRSTSDSSEYQKFTKTSVYQKMADEVSQRLGFKYTLSPKQINIIWDTCRYEQAWKLDKYSVWCSSFTKSHVEVLEYLEDLKYYYKQGYGSQLNNNVPCELVQDMLKHMGTDAEPNVVAYFTHSSAVQLFLTSLGVAKDYDSLRADNYDQMRHRQWRTSKIGPFAANIAAVKYNCANDAQPHKVMFFLNEKPQNFQWCRAGLCDYTAIKDHYRRFEEVNCSNFFCADSGATNQGIVTVIYLIVNIIAIRALTNLILN